MDINRMKKILNGVFFWIIVTVFLPGMAIAVIPGSWGWTVADVHNYVLFYALAAFAFAFCRSMMADSASKRVMAQCGACFALALFLLVSAHVIALMGVTVFHWYAICSFLFGAVALLQREDACFAKAPWQALVMMVTLPVVGVGVFLHFELASWGAVMMAVAFFAAAMSGATAYVVVEEKLTG